MQLILQSTLPLDPAYISVTILTQHVVLPQEDPLRKFYTSLREQRPDSAIAAKW